MDLNYLQCCFRAFQEEAEFVPHPPTIRPRLVVNPEEVNLTQGEVFSPDIWTRRFGNMSRSKPIDLEIFESSETVKEGDEIVYICLKPLQRQVADGLPDGRKVGHASKIRLMQGEFEDGCDGWERQYPGEFFLGIPHVVDCFGIVVIIYVGAPIVESLNPVELYWFRRLAAHDFAGNPVKGLVTTPLKCRDLSGGL